jgi:phosphatidylglycerophosphatase A
MIMVPKEWIWILIGFILFRVFDILKPWPISFIDRRMGGGFGIMFDDAVAALFSLAIIQIAIYFL